MTNVMNERYDAEAKRFGETFAWAKDKNMVLYGIGRFTATLLPRMKESFSFIGLMDRDVDKIGTIVFNLPVMSLDEVEKKADLIIINTVEDYWKIIYSRIIKSKIPVYYLNGILAKPSDLEDDYVEELSFIPDDYKNAIQEADIIGFDIFDTLVVRKTYGAIGIFDVVHNKVKSELNIPFTEYRKKASSLVKEYANLDDIYEILVNFYGLENKTADRIKALEVETEIKYSVSRRIVKNLFDYAIESNKNIIIVSDMYLSSEILKRILKNCGYDISKLDNIYVSCECKKDKETGSIWKYIRSCMEEKKIVFFGDNIISDVEQPQKYGIDAYYIPGIYEISDKAELNQQLIKSETKLQFVLAGLITESLFNNNDKCSNRVVVDSNEQLGYCIFGPLVLYYLLWLRKISLKRNIKQLLFLARDGYFLVEDYNCLFSGYEDMPTGKYLPVSRQLLWEISIYTKTDILNSMKYPYSGLFSDFMKIRYDVDVDVRSNKFNSMEIHLPDGQEKLWEAVKSYEKEILSNANRDRENYLRFLKDFNVDNNNGIIDLGFSGSIQRGLSKLLNLDFIGLYIAADEIIGKTYEKPVELISCYKGNTGTYESSAVGRKVTFLESWLTAPYGMIRRIDENGNMICSKSRKNQEVFDKKIEINNGVKKLIEDVRSMINLKSYEIKESDMRFVDELYGLLGTGAIKISELAQESFYYDNAALHNSESFMFN